MAPCAQVLRLPTISTAVVDSVLSRAAAELQSGDPQAATQASAALIASANAREAEGGGGLDAAQATQMREDVLEIVRSAAAATAPTAAAVGQTAAAVEAVVELVEQVSEGAAAQASELVGAVVNASLAIAEPLAEGTSSAVVRAVSSILSAVERLTAAAATATAATAATVATATAAANNNTTNATAVATADSDAGATTTASFPPPPPPSALYAGLRGTLGALAHAMVKGALAGESTRTALAKRVQLTPACTLHVLPPCVYHASAMHAPCIGQTSIGHACT